MCKLALVCVSLSYPGQLLVPDLPEINIVNTHSDISDIDISDSDITDITDISDSESDSQSLLSQHPPTVTSRHRDTETRQVNTAVLFEQLRGKIFEIKIFVEMRSQ